MSDELRGAMATALGLTAMFFGLLAAVFAFAMAAYMVVTHG